MLFASYGPPQCSARALIVALWSLCAGLLSGEFQEAAPLKGGLSPDGKYEVRILKRTDMPDSGNYRYAVSDLQSGSLIGTLDEGGGYYGYDFAKDASTVLWHRSSRCFVLAEWTTKGSRGIRLYHVAGSSGRISPLRDREAYIPNACGRVDAVGPSRGCIVNPLNWEGETLHCALSFSCDRPREGDGYVRQFYSVDFDLRLSYPASGGEWVDSHLGADVYFVRMGNPLPDEDR